MSGAAPGPRAVGVAAREPPPTRNPLREPHGGRSRVRRPRTPSPLPPSQKPPASKVGSLAPLFPQVTEVLGGVTKVTSSGDSTPPPGHPGRGSAGFVLRRGWPPGHALPPWPVMCEGSRQCAGGRPGPAAPDPSRAGGTTLPGSRASRTPRGGRGRGLPSPGRSRNLRRLKWGASRRYFRRSQRVGESVTEVTAREVTLHHGASGPPRAAGVARGSGGTPSTGWGRVRSFSFLGRLPCSGTAAPQARRNRARRGLSRIFGGSLVFGGPGIVRCLYGAHSAFFLRRGPDGGVGGRFFRGGGGVGGPRLGGGGAWCAAPPP